MGFSRQGYWSGLPGPPPGDLLDSGIEPVSITYPALAGEFFTTRTTWEEGSKQHPCPAQTLQAPLDLSGQMV